MLAGFRYIKIRPTLTVSVFFTSKVLGISGIFPECCGNSQFQGTFFWWTGWFRFFYLRHRRAEKGCVFHQSIGMWCVRNTYSPITYFPLWTMGSLFSNYEETTKQIDSKQDDMRKLPNSRWMVTQRKPQKKSRVVSTSFNTSLEDECQCGSSLHVQGEKWKPFETDSQCRGLKPSLGLKLQQQWIPKQISNPVLTTKNRDILVDIPIFCWWYSHC